MNRSSEEQSRCPGAEKGLEANKREMKVRKRKVGKRRRLIS